MSAGCCLVLVIFMIFLIQVKTNHWICICSIITVTRMNFFRLYLYNVPTILQFIITFATPIVIIISMHFPGFHYAKKETVKRKKNLPTIDAIKIQQIYKLLYELLFYTVIISKIGKKVSAKKKLQKFIVTMVFSVIEKNIFR